MLKFKTNFSRILFCIVVSVFGIAVATGIEFVFYPEEFATTAPGKKAIIVIVIAMPVSWIVTGIIRTNAVLNEELTKLVQRDRLTDVATRDFFFARLEDLPEAYGVSLMIDIDHFKAVNDMHGHLVGDSVIQAVAHVMRDQIRDQDIVCRFGGEEFLVFLRAATQEEGWTIAERIRTATEDLATDIDDGQVRVTVSVGGSLKDQLEGVEDAIKRADDCLYQAKLSGRNRTVVDWDNAASRPLAGVGRAWRHSETGVENAIAAIPKSA